MNNLSLCLPFLLSLFIKCGTSARILGFTPVPSISHQIIFRAIWKELALKGHDLTVISPNILNDTSLTNLKEIDVQHTYNFIKAFDVQKRLSRDVFAPDKVLNYFELIRGSTEMALDDKMVQNLIKSSESFDILIVQALHPLLFAMAARFKVPVIGK